MYLRYTTRKKDGKTHRYWRLVRSARLGKRVLQQTVAHLGELDEAGHLKARHLARQLVGEPEQSSLFDDGCADPTVAVRLKGIRITNSRQFGDVYLALALWRGLQFDRCLEEVIEEGKEQVPWAKMAAVLATARLCEPKSELHIAEDWYRRTALRDLLQLSEDEVGKNRLYRTLDVLVEHKTDLEKHLSKRAGELFALENDVLLYDVTSTYFEGQANANPKAKRGYSRDHRPDCKQVCIALVVTFEGFPLGYEVFAGNTHDSTTVQEIVEAMEKRHGTVGRVWVMDRGMMSQENLAWLRQKGRRYILGTPKAELKKWAPEMAEKSNWREIREGIQVKLCPSPDGQETFILCRSEERQKKEKAMQEKFQVRIEKALQKLQERIGKSKKPLQKDSVNRQIGRILQKNQRAAQGFDIELTDDKSAASFSLVFAKRKDFADWHTLSEGTYLLRSNITDWSDERLWKAYIQLTQAEAAFRIQKDPLCLRPIWHQRQDRVEAHILVCFLAFAMWKTLEFWQERAGLGNSPQTILEELSRIQSHDVILPTQSHGEIRLRLIAQPDLAQATLLERLGLVLPKRIRTPELSLAPQQALFA